VTRAGEVVPGALVRGWLGAGLVWLLVAPSVGVLVSTKFTFPDFLGDVPWLTFGRLRPIHVNGVILGAFSTLFIGLSYYVVPRLAGVPMWRARWGRALLWVWNVNLALGFLSLATGWPWGWSRGWEAGELPLPTGLVVLAVLVVLTVQHLMTLRARTQRELYVSLWYLVAALVWTDVNLVLGLLGPSFVPGINNAGLHGLYIHYVVGLWITPAGYVLIYYFLPASVRAPIYSHKLSLIGFWTLALFYPFVGLHHYLYSPIADWAETVAIVSSVLLIVPVWTVLQNFFGTMVGRWGALGTNLPAKFLIMGSLMYLVGCFQGSMEALRSVQEPTHFTDFVVAHSHLTIFGTFVVWAIAGTLYAWPRVGGGPLWSFRLGNWSFWLVTVGIATMGLTLSAQGLQQGFLWMAGAEWLDALGTMRPFWAVRTLAGVAMDVGLSLLVLNLARSGPPGPVAAAAPGPPPAVAVPVGRR
jgi:cytochrome c oxidase cbb3-type subunit 1